MTGLDRKAMDQFYMKPDFVSSAEVTRQTGIAALLAGVQIDDHQFSPLGYSLNGLRGEEYYTIHVTPQPECSFVSFETNMYHESYESFVRQVIGVFKPESFTVLLFSETRSSMEGMH
jgi:S-adenosylmethionine decarboxylase